MSDAHPTPDNWSRWYWFYQDREVTRKWNKKDGTSIQRRRKRIDSYVETEFPQWTRNGERMIVASHGVTEIVAVNGPSQHKILGRYDEWIYPRKHWKRATDQWVQNLLRRG